MLNMVFHICQSFVFFFMLYKYNLSEKICVIKCTIFHVVLIRFYLLKKFSVSKNYIWLDINQKCGSYGQNLKKKLKILGKLRIRHRVSQVFRGCNKHKHIERYITISFTTCVCIILPLNSWARFWRFFLQINFLLTRLKNKLFKYFFCTEPTFLYLNKAALVF